MSSHKTYLHCVAQVAKTAAQSWSLPKACRAAVLGCAGPSHRAPRQHAQGRRTLLSAAGAPA